MLGYASPSSKSLSTALSAPLAGSAVEGANTLLMPIQPNDVAIRSLQRNAMFATLPAGVAARLGTSATTVGQALAAGEIGGGHAHAIVAAAQRMTGCWRIASAARCSSIPARFAKKRPLKLWAASSAP